MHAIRLQVLIGLISAAALAQTAPDPPHRNPGAGSARPEDPLQQPAARSPVQSLYSRVAAVEFDEAPLDAAIEWLRQTTRVNIVVQWDELEKLGVRRDTPISIRARNLRFSQLLWLILNQPDIKEARLAYRADADMLLITTEAALGEQMITKAYDVSELLAPRAAQPSLFVGRTRQVPIAVVPVVAQGAVAVQPVLQQVNSGVLLQADDPGGDDFDDADNEAIRERRIQQLINVITTTIEPQTWAVNGGRGTIAAFRGTLVVRNTPLVHQQLGGALTEAESP